MHTARKVRCDQVPKGSDLKRGVKKTKPAQTPDLARLRGEIAKHGSVLTGIAAFKLKSDVTRVRKLLPEALRTKVFQQIIWPNEHPKLTKDIWHGGIPVLAPFKMEVEWSTQTIRAQKKIIAAFLPLKSVCEKLYLESRTDELDKTLNEIEEKFGQSLWLIEARINAIQLAAGFNAQREYTSDILKDKSVPEMVRYIVSWLSFRSEENLSAQEFVKIVEESIPPHPQFAGLLRIALGVERVQSTAVAAACLAHSASLPPIDRYLYYLATIQAVVAGNIIDIIDELRWSVSALAKEIDDPALSRLSIVLGDNINPKGSDLLPTVNAYVTGDYDRAMTEAVHLITDRASVDALIMAVRIEALQNRRYENKSNESSVFAKIATDLVEVTLAGQHASDAEARLAKLRTSSPTSGWSASLDLFLARQRNDERLFPPQTTQTYSALRAQEENPTLAYCFSADMAQSYLNQTFGPTTADPAVQDVRAVIANHSQGLYLAPPTPRNQRLDALRSLRNGDTKRAIHELADIDQRDASPLDCLEQDLLNVEVRLSTGDLKTACELCVKLILLSAYLARRLPMKRLVQALADWDRGADRDDRVLGEFSIVIFLNLYARYHSDDRDELANDAFLDLLDKQNIEKPSDLVGSFTQISDWDIYFMRHICVPDTLDQCFSLRSTRDVEDERVRIIVRCGDLYVESQRSAPIELQDELQQIRTKQVIRDTSLKLDQSKIFVDTDGIQATLGTFMRESWNRYRLLGLQQEVDGDMSHILRDLEGALGAKIAFLTASPPVTERNKLFGRMFKEIRDQFASSKFFGLDANLSTNVRHGYILRELRGPFVAKALVTNLISAESGYRQNKYWFDRLFEGDEDPNRSEMMDALDEFSAEIDAEIERLTRKRIRINSESNSEGLFVFAVSSLDIHILQQRVESLETYEDFLKACFDVLWAVAQIGLNRVKHCLRVETLNHFNSALDKLQDRADEYLDWEQAPLIKQAISLARPEVDAAVERVSSWFALSTSHEYQDYPLQIAFDVGLATVTSYFSHLDIDASIEGAEKIMMAGWTLPSFARLFLLLMENAALHAGVTEGRLAIKASATLSTSILDISVSNELASSTNYESLENTVNKLNGDFGGEKAQDSVGTERGSGYPKLWKILRHDLRRDHDIEVKVSEHSLFDVRVMISREGIAL